MTSIAFALGLLIPTGDASLVDLSGVACRLRDWNSDRVLVVAFLGTECPVARQYAARLQEIEAAFRHRGVRVLGVFANPADSARSIARMGQEMHLTYPMLRDPDQSLADRWSITRQPEVVVLDSSRIIRYRGRVDDQDAPGSHRPIAAHRYLRNALEEILTGRTVTIPSTEPAGCPLERRRFGSRDAASYSRDAERILERHCVTCHQAGGIAPFELTSLAAATRWSGAIREAVRDRRMPPWHADPAHGHFANDPSLSDAERTALLRWCDAGGPLPGDGTAVIQGVKTDRWQIPAPDLVIPLPNAFQLPPTGDIAYQEFEVDPGFAEDRWVHAAEIRPGNRSVVHHSTVFLKPPGVAGLAAQGDLKSFCLAAYAMGTPPMTFPHGMAKKVPAGWKLVFVMHYVTTGSPQSDRTELGLCFTPASAVRREVATNILISEQMTIPPRASRHVESQSRMFEKDVLLLALFPHMHLRGISFRYEAQYPDGRIETLLSIPKWDFNWQHRYVLAEPKRLPAGTVLTATGVYDNSPNNPNNPDPDAEVHAGPQSTDEMFNGYYDFCLADEAPVTNRLSVWLWLGLVLTIAVFGLLAGRVANRPATR